jgi:hypothetical protein
MSETAKEEEFLTEKSAEYQTQIDKINGRLH